MNWIEILLITAGISLDIFGGVACQGALVAKVNAKRVALLCLLYVVWQTAALYVGSFAASLLCAYDLTEDAVVMGRVIATAIFILLGVRMIWKAIKEANIVERRQETLSIKKAASVLALVTAYTMLTGVGFGFLATEVWLLLPMIAVITVIAVVLGVYTGYRLGSEQKTKAYFIGGILLLAGGIDVIVRYLVLS